jgi:hypothetical protein
MTSLSCYTLSLTVLHVKITICVSGSGSQCRIRMDNVSSYLTEPKLLHTCIIHPTRPEMHASHCYLGVETRTLIKCVDVNITTVHHRSVCTS